MRRESRPTVGVGTRKLADVLGGVQRKESDGDEIVKLVKSKLAVERWFNFPIELLIHHGHPFPVFPPPEAPLNGRID